MQCAVLISVIFCSSMAVWWPCSNWRFWYNPSLIVPNTPIKTCTIFVLLFHILLTLISRSLYLLSFSVSFVLTSESSGVAISISMQVFSFLSCSTVSGWYASVVWSVITGTSYITVVPLTFNLLKPNDIYICRTAALTSRRYILNIYSTNIHTEYFKCAT